MILVRQEGRPDLRIARVLRRHLAAHAEMIEEFLRVGRALDRIRHANLVRVHDVGTLFSGQPYMVMDYVHGRDLRELLVHPTPRHHERVAEVGLQMASGLAAAHGAGLLHLDLTPANVLLVGATEEARIQIVNFDMAAVMRRWAPAASEDVPLSMEAPAYWSPERANGDEVDARSDIYSLGIILFELLTGRVPFPSQSVDEVIAQQLYAEPPTMQLLPGTSPSPEALHSIVKCCLAKDPSDRFQNAQDLRAALDSASGDNRAIVPDGSHVDSSISRSGWSTSPASGRLAWRFIMAVGSCATAIALIIGMWSARSGMEVGPGLVQDRPPEVRITLTSDPPGALVYRAKGGAALGRTPFTISLPRSDEPLEMLFRFPDGPEQRLRTVPARSMRVHVRAEDGPSLPAADAPGES